MRLATRDIMTGNLFPSLYARLAAQPRITRVERVPAGERGLPRFAALATAGYPVLIEDGVSVGLAQLVDVAGDLVISVRMGAYADPTIYAGKRTLRTCTLREYVAEVRGGGPDVGYAGNQRISSVIASALGSWPPPHALENDLEAPSLWVGPAESCTPLHKDSADNFSMQRFGCKRWTLFPVGDAPRLALGRVLDTPGFTDFAISAIDLRHELPPTDAVPIVVEVHAGEVLYVPAGWSHFVQAVGPSPSLTINAWVDPLRRGPRSLA